MEDYYEILGISKNASQDEVKKSYRKLSLQNHPDRNKSADANEKFAKINEAHEVLSDERKRRAYDTQSSMGGFPHMPGFPPGMFPGSGVEIHNMDDIFTNLFGGMAGMAMGGAPPEVHVFGNMSGLGGGMGSIPEMFKNLQKPPPITKSINISMEESYYGGNFPLEIDRWFIMNNSKVTEKDTLNITIPPGVDNNEIIVLREKGNMINQHQKGDVKVFVNIGDHEYFTRHGLDLLYTKTITLKESLCGFAFEIQHLNKRTITFNNTKSNMIMPHGYRKVVNNLGFQKGTHLGNLIIEFEVEFPESLTEEQIKNIKDIL